MPKFALINTRIFAGGADLTGQSNKVELSAEVADGDVTTFGSAGSTEVIGTMKKAEVSAEGFWEAGDPSKVDNQAWTGIAGVGAWTICPLSANVGDLAWVTSALNTKYTLGGAVGDVAPWQAGGNSSNPLVRGQVLHPPGTARVSTGVGTARQVGALATGQRLYVALHVLSVAGTGSPSITVAVESDDASGFASPTSRGTFTAATAQGSQTLVVPGPVTDDWWRVRWTVSGSSPSFLFVASAGIFTA